MSSLLDNLRFAAGEGTLRILEDELKGTLNCIVYDGKAGDLEWVKKEREYFRKKHGKFLSDRNIETFFGKPANLITNAYFDFVHYDLSNFNSEYFTKEMKDTLHENLLLGDLLACLDEEEKEFLRNLEVFKEDLT